jgi:3-dehydroquinate dehydratase I
MNLPRNKLNVCVTLVANSVDKLPFLFSKAVKKEANYVEIRFDHMIYKDIDRALLLSSEIKNKAIFTLRSKKEGGFFYGTRSEQVSLLKKMAKAKPMLLDIEYSIIKKDSEFLKFLKYNKVPILVSSHDFRKTPEVTSLLEKIRDMRKYSNYVKLVTTARSFRDNLNFLSLYDNNKNTNLIAFAMGDLGVLSRLLCMLYGGAPFTYASLDDAVAPGQLDVVLMKKIFERVGNKLKNK